MAPKLLHKMLVLQENTLVAMTQAVCSLCAPPIVIVWIVLQVNTVKVLVMVNQTVIVLLVTTALVLQSLHSLLMV
jgi:hypothetical protein